MNEHLFSLAAITDQLADAAARTGESFGFHWSHFIAQTISFCIVAFLLYKFAYKPILTVLEERRTQIREGLENAEKIKKELAATEAQRKEVLTQANAEANKMIEEARAAANLVREHETQKAISSAEQIIAKAREASRADHDRMIAELKREIGQLVVRTTAQVVGKVMSPEDEKRLVEETNKQIAA